MRAIELFAGVGGFRLGLERAGHQVVWANEWDRFACDIYDKNFGGKIDRRDITTIRAEEIPSHDLISGGFPCQAFSVAGRRQGFEETRGTLFFDICRIARHHRTPYLFLENVKGLLNHDGGRTFETIIRTLDGIGYDLQWQVINSKDFGVPQNRERIIIVGHLRGKSRPQVFPLTQDGGVDSPTRRKTGPQAQISNTIRAKAGGGRGDIQDAYIVNAITSHPGGPDANDQYIMQRPRGKNEGGVYDIAPTVQQGMGDGNIVVATGIANRGREDGVNWEARGDGLAGALRTAGGSGSTPHALVGSSIRRLTPVECERLQGFPDNWTAGVSDTQRYKQMGNAVTVNVIEAVARKL
jgi:DNA (cytosine-5)-methyltransferase 1